MSLSGYSSQESRMYTMYVCVGVCTHKLCFQCSVCSENRECNSQLYFKQPKSVFQVAQQNMTFVKYDIPHRIGFL